MKVHELLRKIFFPYVLKRSSTVRYAFPIAFVAVALVAVAILGTETSSYITIESEPSFVRAGDKFTISIIATAHTPTNAVDVEVSYPKDRIKVLGIDIGESVITIWTEEPYARNGTIKLRGGIFRRGFIGKHVLARVQARALETGVAHIVTADARFLAGDGAGTEIELADTDTDEARVYIANKDGSLVGKVGVTIVTDLDGDGDVDLSDIYAFMTAWRTRSVIFDFNGDGKITFRDFAIILADSFFK